MSDLAAAIEAAWDSRDSVTPASHQVGTLVEQALDLLDSGQARWPSPMAMAAGPSING